MTNTSITVLFLTYIGVFLCGLLFGLNIRTIQPIVETTIKSVEGTNDSYRIWMEVKNVPCDIDKFIIHADMKDILNAIDKYKADPNWINK
jgi:hypothetical protein